MGGHNGGILTPMYEDIFDSTVNRIKAEGRYRVFMEIDRDRGAYPHGSWRSETGDRDIIVWCSNDYLGMSQHPKVLAAMKETLNAQGAGAGGTRNISGTSSAHRALEQELAVLHKKDAALLFTSGYNANDATLSTLGRLLPRLHHLFRCAQSCLHDRGHSAQPGPTNASFVTMM